MVGILRQRATHAGRLERWLGVETVEHLSASMAPWYGPPIAVHNVPGAVYAMKGGDFHGVIGAGQIGSALDFAADRLKAAVRRYSRRSHATLGTGFASLSDLIAEVTGGKQNTWAINKVGSTGVVGVTNSLWGLGPQPAAGSASSAAPGGIAPTDATTGALPFANPTGGDTQHFLRADIAASLQNTLLLYDRIFGVAKTMASTSTESVTGVPTRYQSTTAGAADSAEGNFLFVEVGGTALAATAHNWTTCLYTDQSGNGSSTLPSLTGNSSAIVRRLDHPAQQWFAPLASGDTGIKELDQMQCSASVATGLIDFVIGHPIAWIPCPLVNFVVPADGLRTAFNMTRIFDDAALALLEVCKPATGATTYTGTIQAAYG